MVYSKKDTLREIEEKKEQNKPKFTPEICRGPTNDIHGTMPIHDRLLNEGDRLMQKRNERKEEKKRAKTLMKIQTTSTEILEQKKKYILTNVFEVLDEAGEGTISADNCDFEKLNSELKEFFRPLIEELSGTDEKLDKEGFIDCSLQLYKKLTPTQRNNLIEAGKVHDRTPTEEYHSFSPYVSKKSTILAESVRPQADTVEDRLLSGGYAKEDKNLELVDDEY